MCFNSDDSVYTYQYVYNNVCHFDYDYDYDYDESEPKDLYITCTEHDEYFDDNSPLSYGEYMLVVLSIMLVTCIVHNCMYMCVQILKMS